ncbi:MAG: hypothetical protein GY731_13705, partial [Gammaproteobacteria bacterium]|nr:hypothetical protein [Gammaproteobacteria bacterium]
AASRTTSAKVTAPQTTTASRGDTNPSAESPRDPSAGRVKKAGVRKRRGIRLNPKVPGLENNRPKVDD